MKIAFCIFKYFPYGGLQRDFLSIATACIAKGYEVDVYTMEWRGPCPAELQVTIIPKKGFTNHRSYWLFAKAVYQYLSKNHYDRVIGFNKIPGLDIYFAGDPCFAHRFQQLPTLLQKFSPRYRGLRDLEQAVLSNAVSTQILTISDKQQGDFQTYYQIKKERLHALPPQINRDRFYHENHQQLRYQLRQQLQLSDDNLLCLLVGSGFKTKGVDRALLAMAHLPVQLRQKCRFYVIGDDEPKKFMKMAARLNIRQQCYFLSGRDDIANFLAAADVLVHPAYSETAGLIILEAIVAGLPVLVTDSCGYAHHVQQSGAGIILSSPFSQQQCDQALENMLSSKEFRQRWQEQGIAYGHHFSQEAMIQAVMAIIDKMPVNQEIPLPRNVPYQWLSRQSCRQIMQQQGDVKRALEGRKTLRFEKNGKGYYAKLHFGVGWREIFKNMMSFRLPVISATNEYQAIKYCHDYKINTMTVVAYAKWGFNPAKKKSFIITQELADTLSLEEFFQQCPVNQRIRYKIIQQVASITRRLHENGLNHRDLYICHFLIDISMGLDNIAANHIKIYLIDLHRAQKRKSIRKRWQIKDLASLYFSSLSLSLTKKEYLLFMKHYFNKPLKYTLSEQCYILDAVIKKGIKLSKKPISQ